MVGLFRLCMHPVTDVAMKWEQTMLQGQPPANKAARSITIHIVHDTLISGKLRYPAILWCQASQLYMQYLYLGFRKR